MQPRGGPLLTGAGHDEYPSRFDVDMETQMLGSVKPYALQVRPAPPRPAPPVRRRQLPTPRSPCAVVQVVISTGKSDWDREVTDTSGSLAKYLDAARGEYKPPKNRSAKDAAPAGADGLPGVHRSTESSKVTILNGSHRTVSEDAARETVLVFPEYKIVTEVTSSAEGAWKFWHSLKTGAEESDGLKTYVLPYSSVIMLCECDGAYAYAWGTHGAHVGSHKRRDNRCAIAAPKLEHTFTAALEREGWEVHTQVEDPSLSGPPLEDLTGTEEEKRAKIEKRLKDAAEHKRVLIIRNSHMGGHKFAGNVIVRALPIWESSPQPE